MPNRSSIPPGNPRTYHERGLGHALSDELDRRRHFLLYLLLGLAVRRVATKIDQQAVHPPAEVPSTLRHPALKRTTPSWPRRRRASSSRSLDRPDDAIPAVVVICSRRVRGVPLQLVLPQPSFQAKGRRGRTRPAACKPGEFDRTEAKHILYPPQSSIQQRTGHANDTPIIKVVRVPFPVPVVTRDIALAANCGASA
jgi:hypothetical protein